MKNLSKKDKEKLITELELDLIEKETYINLVENSIDEMFYKEEIENIKNNINKLKNEGNKKVFKNKIRPNKYSRKKIGKEKLRKLYKESSWWVIDYNEDSKKYKRYYLSETKKYAKKQSNKKVRNSLNFSLKGGGYRKCYDYWWEVI